jgi:hypothetical protein
VKKPTAGFDNGLGAILIGEHSLASFLSKKSPEGILGLFQQHRPKADIGESGSPNSHAQGALAKCGALLYRLKMNEYILCPSLR